MKLNYRIRTDQNTSLEISVIMLHGLFGDLNNLRKIATSLMKYYPVIQVDLRNHGNSMHMPSMTYPEMAQDILDLLDQLLIKKCIIIGHSMGGKIAMTLCRYASHRIYKIVVIDIAPVNYDVKNLDNIFNAIEYVNQFNICKRKDAMICMKKKLTNIKIINFLLKSFRKGSWVFNFLYIKNNYHIINSWKTYQKWWGSILFIKGEYSSYLHDKYLNDIYYQFPNARIHTIPKTGHWVHYENPTYVINVIEKFILY